MKGEKKTKKQLVSEMAEMHRRITDIEESERQRAKLGDEVEVERNKLQAIIDALEHGLTIQNPDYDIIFQNEFLKKMFGGLGGKCYRVYEGRDRPCDGCPVEMAYEDGRTHTSERRVVMPTGEVTFWENTASPIRDANGEIVSCLEVARNITKRKAAEEELRKHRDHLDQLVRERTKELTCLYGLSRLADRPDAPPEELLASVPELVASAWQYPEITCARVLFEGKELATDNFKATEWHQLAHIFANGQKVGTVEVCYLQARPAADEGPFLKEQRHLLNAIAELLGRQIERWRAEEALRRSELLNRSLVEHLPQRIFVKDPNSVYMSCNANYARDLEIQPEQIVGKDDFAFHPRELAEKYRADDKAVMDSGIPKDMEEKYVVAGEERWVHTAKVPFHDEQSHVIGVLGIFEDITERKQAERRLQHYAERLEALNAELARSNRDLEEFTYAVSHDLQEPLRKIHTFGQFLAEDCGENLPEAGREHLRRIEAASARMKTLIQHLLCLGRVGTEGKELVPVDLRSVVEEVLDVLGEQAEACQASIVLRDGFPRVMGDAVQLGQVFQNLIGNALKFRAPGRTPSIVISAHVEGPTATLAVADNGIGIEERHFDRIFGIFQRLHAREQYEGEGVGLALCAKIIRRHGGRIWVESEVGKGSTFFFTLQTVAEREGKDGPGRSKPADAAGSPG